MWDDDDAAPVSQNNGASAGNGFYFGRGRGFGNMSSVSKALPEVGGNPVSNGASHGGWEEDNSGWGEKPASTQSSNSFGGQSNSFGNSQSREARSKSSVQNGWSNNRSRSNNRGSGCFKCGQDGHMSRDCTNSTGGRGGGSRACHKCGEEGHMARECPQGGGGGGSRACHKCGEEGHMARECPSGGSGGGGSRACHKCGEEGHMARECPQGGGGGGSRACHKCGEEGHMARECPSGGGGSRACHKCGEEGHMARECPQGGGGGGSRACHKCGEEGHMARECPTGGGGGGSRACHKCGEEGHIARECPSAEPVLDENGKPRPPIYVPPEMSEDQDTLFQCVPAGINFDRYDDISVDVSGTNAPPPMKSFKESGLCNLLCENVQKSNYTKPTPVQKYAIPIIMKKRDLMACAQTGSGKTAAFLLPILNDMVPNGDLPNMSGKECQEPWAIIIAPTRELVIQIGTEAKKFSYDSVVKADVLYGGTSTGYQWSRMKRGVHVVAATPGRLLDFVDKGKVSFAQLKYLVLDEADRMLDMGFAGDIRKMVEHPTMPEKGSRQTLMFSATFPEEIQKLASEFLENYLFLTVGMVGAANTDVEQTFFSLGQFEKRQKLLEILQEAGSDRTLVFVEQKRTADFIASFTSQNSIPTTSIHGDRLQKEREEALRDFRNGTMSVLVATAVAARGLDIKGVKHVINYDLPKTIDEYVHRIGRTGRVGNTGKATSFYDPSVDQDLARSLKKILIDAKQEIPDWLHDEAAQASGSTVQYGGRGQRDVRNQGRTNNRSSEDAYDNYQQSAPSYNAVTEDDAWD